MAPGAEAGAGTAAAGKAALAPGATGAAARSRMLVAAGARIDALLLKYASASVQTKNTAAHTAVERDRKLALPDRKSVV